MQRSELAAPRELIRRVLEEELRPDAAASAEFFSVHASGMFYAQCYVGRVQYHIGVGRTPYPAEVSGQPPGEPESRLAWLRHEAWMYVDAVLYAVPDERDVHFANVMRLAGRFVDERCVLIWLHGPREQPKRVALPTAENVAALRAGRWPGL